MRSGALASGACPSAALVQLPLLVSGWRTSLLDLFAPAPAGCLGRAPKPLSWRAQRPFSRYRPSARCTAHRSCIIQAADEACSGALRAQDVCQEYGIPTAQHQRFSEPALAKEFVRRQGVPIVIKADGLAAGKGVYVAHTEQDALAAVDAILVHRQFGDAGAPGCQGCRRPAGPTRFLKNDLAAALGVTCRQRVDCRRISGRRGGVLLCARGRDDVRGARLRSGALLSWGSGRLPACASACSRPAARSCRTTRPSARATRVRTRAAWAPTRLRPLSPPTWRPR